MQPRLIDRAAMRNTSQVTSRDGRGLKQLPDEWMPHRSECRAQGGRRLTGLMLVPRYKRWTGATGALSGKSNTTEKTLYILIGTNFSYISQR
eukprot:scaffold370656_cov21-Prasinocladus_malaysianus.AAC.1